MWVRSQGPKNQLGEDMVTHSSNFCLENPVDRGAWRATVHRVTKSWTRLQQLSTHTHTMTANDKIRAFQMEENGQWCLTP